MRGLKGEGSVKQLLLNPIPSLPCVHLGQITQCFAQWLSVDL